MAKSKCRPTRRPPEDASEPSGGAAFRYVETSALLAAVLEGDMTAGQALRGEGLRIASALTFAEAGRAIVRARATARMTPAGARVAIRRLQRFERHCAVVAVTDAVLARAGRPFPVEPLRTLDAIHLATAEAIEASPQLVTIVTRDRRVRANAAAMGFTVE